MGKLLIAITVVASAIIGYCIYFDRQRRLDPDYKKKIRQRRMEAKRKNETPPETSDESIKSDETSSEALERFFMQEIQLGEQMIASGDFEEGVFHLVKGILVCPNPVRLLNVLKQEMPPHVHKMVIDGLNAAREQLEHNPEMSASSVYLGP